MTGWLGEGRHKSYSSHSRSCDYAQSSGERFSSRRQHVESSHQVCHRGGQRRIHVSNQHRSDEKSGELLLLPSSRKSSDKFMIRRRRRRRFSHRWSRSIWVESCFEWNYKWQIGRNMTKIEFISLCSPPRKSTFEIYDTLFVRFPESSRKRKLKTFRGRTRFVSIFLLLVLATLQLCFYVVIDWLLSDWIPRRCDSTRLHSRRDVVRCYRSWRQLG